MKQNRLPQYWIVQQCDDPRWHKVIDYINTIGSNWIGATTRAWYGFDGNSNIQNGMNHYNKPNHFQNNPVQLTLDQFIEMTEDFVLPENWCIKGCAELRQWYNHFKSNEYINFGQYYGEFENNTFGITSNKKPLEYTEITFGQFIEHVVNKLKSFDPLDWNIECKNAAQTREVLDWIELNCTESVDNCHKGSYSKYVRYQPSDWGGNQTRNDFYPIEKSITWEQFQSLKKEQQHQQIMNSLNAPQPLTYSPLTNPTTTMTNSNDQSISKVDLKKIYDIVCEDWQRGILESVNMEPFSNSVSFSDEVIMRGFREANDFQKIEIKKYFKINNDKNAFIKASGNDGAIRNLSQQLFGDRFSFQLLKDAVNDLHPELKERGFYVNPRFEVKTGTCSEGGTWISIFKKD